MANKTFSIVDTEARVDAAVAAICANRHYPAVVADPNDPNATIPNPVTPEQFAGSVVVAFCEDEVRQWAQGQADSAANAAKDGLLQPLRTGSPQVSIG